MSTPLLISYLASGFSAAALLMTRMIPLRMMIIVSNLLSIAYGLMIQDYSLTALHAVLLPLNIYRLRQMQSLIGKVERASQDTMPTDWLTTFMSRRRIATGELVFRRGDEANEIYYLVSGQFRVTELHLDLPVGSMVGEVGLLAPGKLRSQSLQCLADGEVLVASYDEVHELFFQNPEFGYHFLRLASRRLFNDVGRLEKEVADLRRTINSQT